MTPLQGICWPMPVTMFGWERFEETRMAAITLLSVRTTTLPNSGTFRKETIALNGVKTF